MPAAKTKLRQPRARRQPAPVQVITHSPVIMGLARAAARGRDVRVEVRKDGVYVVNGAR